MAMIKCRECGKEISDMAETCPNCGWITQRGQTKSKAKGLAVDYMFCIVELIAGPLLFVSGLGKLSIFKMLLGALLAICGFVSLMIVSAKAKKLSENQEDDPEDDVVTIAGVEIPQEKVAEIRQNVSATEVQRLVQEKGIPYGEAYMMLMKEAAVSQMGAED